MFISAAAFDGGNVSSKSLGNLSIQGSVFFVSTAFKFLRNQTEEIAAAKEWLNNELEKLLDLNVAIYNIVQISAESAFYFAPNFKWPSQEMKIFLKANFFLWSFDDYCDNATICGKENLLDKDSIFELANNIANIFLGKFPTIDDIALTNTSKIQNSLCKLMFNIYLELRQIIPNDYEIKAVPMANGWRNLILHSLTHVAPCGKLWNSDDVHLAVRVASGAIPITELIALLQDVHLPAEVM